MDDCSGKLLCYIFVFLSQCFQILFQCETCENELAAPYNLERHKGKNMKQETKVFNCEMCKNEFPSIGNLKKHLKRIHEVKNLASEENSDF